jgi:hypothetical protein
MREAGEVFGMAAAQHKNQKKELAGRCHSAGWSFANIIN